MISKGFGFVAFFASDENSSVCYLLLYIIHFFILCYVRNQKENRSTLEKIWRRVQMQCTYNGVTERKYTTCNTYTCEV